jgi:hypothetical protein
MSFPDDCSVRLENVDIVLAQKIPEKAGIFKSLIFGCGGRICSRSYHARIEESRLKLIGPKPPFPARVSAARNAQLEPPTQALR